MKPLLSRSLFWDIDFESIDYEKNARFVIERVLARGTLDDWYSMKDFYGLKRLKQEVVSIRYLDKKTLNFCHIFFNIKKEKFRCYNTEPSIRKLWDY